MRILILAFMLSTMVFGFSYDDVVLKAQASIFPKIMLLDKKLEDKLVDGKIVYTIVYDNEDIIIAEEIREYINSKHNGHFDIYRYTINLVEYSELSNKTEATAIYALNSYESIDKVAQIAKDKGIVAFCYDVNNLRRGLLFSLMMEKSTVIYLNKENLYTNKVDFIDSLYQIVRFIDKTHG